jgi:hypothetical protein
MTKPSITQDETVLAPMTRQELIEILGLTIKHDEENKLATFLCALTAYTEGAQFNISFNAPSATGKSFIPMEIARLFPEEDVIEIAYCSPTAFFHDTGKFDKEKKMHVVDLANKILIFLDQPHNELLARLRPLLSHDKKEMQLKITDKNQSAGLRTKTVLLRGYPSVIFCTAGLRIDEQESTRMLLLSPDVSQEKIRESISATIRKESDSQSYKDWLEANPERALLKERIRSIKSAGITDINITDYEKVEKRFLARQSVLKSRHNRDVRRLISLIKGFALLNVFSREREGSVLTANQEDIDAGFAIWDRMSETQDLNIPPYIFNLYKEVIIAAWEEKNAGLKKSVGITRKEVMEKHYRVYGRYLDGILLGQQIIPMLQTVGLVLEERDPTDRRKYLISPIVPEVRNSATRGGVKKPEIT